MKHIILYVFFLRISIILLLVFGLYHSYAHAQVGCIDKSHHLKEWPDFKTYHYTSCNCPCNSYYQFDERGMCQKCGHYHAPEKLILITPENMQI
ncbi:MAG TPA: hypothetical protein VJ201_06840 [Candidatus Babeliales bacterium]|nr:hypothetical protein [Candidatus Babeliales bacterium]